MVTPNLTRQRNKALRPGGKTIRIHEEPLNPGTYILRMQGNDIAAIDLEEGIIEYVPERTTPEIVRRFLQEYFGFTDEDIVGFEVMRR